ncbi:MAG: hypothetical protein RBR22_11670 [Desulfuromonas sp.]|nr:hypothetical protein [Desulfuromonas sp.]
MYFVPLSQFESVELIVHALRAAAGEADCKQCPARKVCMKQCLLIADSIQSMIANGTLPALDSEPEPQQQSSFHQDPAPQEQEAQNIAVENKKGHLHVVK